MLTLLPGLTHLTGRQVSHLNFVKLICRLKEGVRQAEAGPDKVQSPAECCGGGRKMQVVRANSAQGTLRVET